MHRGLTQQQVLERRRRYGENMLPEAKPPSSILIFFSQFKSPFIYVLLVAAVVSLGLKQTLNSIFIGLVLLINAFIGTVQEYAAEKAANSLKKLVPSRATVIRDNQSQQVDTKELVPDDIVLVGSGDKVPADMDLINSDDLLVDESMLTGESIAVLKNKPGDKVFAGTVVLRGRATGCVKATAAHTEIGKIALDVSHSQLTKPPLLQRIDRFTKRVSIFMLLLIVLIFIITYLRGDDIYNVFLLGVALAVSAIPEGLPVAITVALAIGMQRMARCGVIVRKLIAIESLGSCTYVASDKTGTLTVNQMTVKKILLANGDELKVTGEGMSCDGYVDGSNPNNQTLIDLVTHSGIATNEATLIVSEQDVIGTGDTVDQAFLVLAEKQGIDTAQFRVNNPLLESIPYESEQAFSASLNNYQKKPHLFVKGSAEKVATFCANPKAIEALSHRLTRQGYRVIALAYKPIIDIPTDLADELKDLRFVGLVGIIDPCRPEAIKAVHKCREASIKVAMVTGDHPETAAVLSGELGIARQHVERPKDKPVTGTALKQAQQKGTSFFNKIIRKARIFARVEPHQKKEIVDSLMAQGEFVAMTGDGVNDAPALKSAHVGIAMGKRGTDVARESADIILTDDNFASIVEGIKQGRIVYNNIRKVIFLLISTGAAEIAIILLSLLFGMPLPLLPIQLLWLNLVTNGIQDVALVFDPEEGDELTKPPREPKEPIFDALMIQRVIVNAIFMGGIAFSVFWYLQTCGVGLDASRNLCLLQMVLFENIHVFNSRSETSSVFAQNFFGNPLLLMGVIVSQAVHIGAMYVPVLKDILVIAPVTIHQWVVLLACALILIVVDEVHKLWHKHHSHI